MWAVNPLRVEPVAWASARIYGVSSLFMLLSWLAYLRAGEAGGTSAGQDGDVSPKRRRWFWGSVLCYGLSLFTYPIALGGVVVFVALDIWVLRRLPQNPARWLSAEVWPVWKEKLFLFIPMGMMLLMTLVSRGSNTHIEPLASFSDFSVGARVMQAFYVYAYYVWKPWLPLELAPKYPTLLDFDPWTPPFLLSALAVVAITVLLCWWHERRPALIGLWVCHLAMFVPLLGLTERHHHAFDRYSYLPGIAWALLVALACRAAWLSGWKRGLLVAALLVWSGVSLLWSQQQVLVWNNSFNLQLRIVESLGDDPECASHETILGLLYLRAGHLTVAEDCFREAVRLDPSLTEPRNNLGDILAEKGQVSAAIDCYQQAIQVKPEETHAYVNLGVTLARAGRLEEAVKYFERALKLDPDDAATHQNLALALRALGRPEAAQPHLERARNLRAKARPDNP